MPPTPKPIKFNLDDGLIRANGLTGGPCEACGQRARNLRITRVTLPEGVKPSSKLLLFHDERHTLEHIGLTCGCYAKAHRQIAHIHDRMVMQQGGIRAKVKAPRRI